MISTSDSRIRSFDSSNGKLIQKYRGKKFQNRKFLNYANFSCDENFVFCGSDNKKLIAWEIPKPLSEFNPSTEDNKVEAKLNEKNANYDTTERFKFLIV